MDEEVYIKLPKIFGDSPLHKIRQLLKAVYVHKRCAQLWNGHASTVLKTLEFTESKIDGCFWFHI